MRVEQLTSDDGKCGTGRAHALKLRMLEGELLDVRVGRSKGVDQGAGRIAVEIAVVEVAYRFDGEAAGFLPAFVSAHTVSHDGETAFAPEVVIGIGLPIEVRILIVGAMQPDVAQRRGFDSWFWLLRINGHK